jgi:hypothetical protein
LSRTPTSSLKTLFSERVCSRGHATWSAPERALQSHDGNSVATPEVRAVQSGRPRRATSSLTEAFFVAPAFVHSVDRSVSRPS